MILLKTSVLSILHTLGERVEPTPSLGFTWTLKVCKIMAFMAAIMGLRLLYYILLGVHPKP